MRDELAREIEAGGGTDDAVALALGLQHKMMMAAPGEGWFIGSTFCHPGSEDEPPAFLTDLNALAAECERRQWDIDMHTDGGCPYASVTTCDGQVFDSHIDDAPTLARALAAALVRAAGETR